MIEGKTIVCLSVRSPDDPEPAQDWELMQEFARSNRILLVDRSRRRRDALHQTGALWVLTPPPLLPVESLPAGGLFEAASRANRAVLKAVVLSALARLGAEVDILWVGFDLAGGAALVGALGERICVYHCLDEARLQPKLARHGPALERRIVGRSHVVFASTPALARTQSQLGVPVIYLPPGVDHPRFADALDPDIAPPSCLSSLPRPLLTYAGPLDDAVDFHLLEKVALAFPEASLAIGGEVRDSSHERLRILQMLPNVHALGAIPRDDLPAFLKAVDVGLIPLRRRPATFHGYSRIALEYLAVGKPVVSTDFADLGEFSPPVRVVSGSAAFCFAIRAALAQESLEASRARSRFAQQHSWQQRTYQASAVLQGLLQTPVCE